MAKIYYESEGDIEILKEKVISIIGYGNQGRSQALNLRDSGVNKIIVGSIADRSFDVAKADGFEVMSIEEAIKVSDIVFLLIPDEVAANIFETQIRPYLKAGACINFSSAYNITFKNIVPPEDIDVIMVAPRMIGEGVRELYESNEGFPSFVSVYQDYTGKAKDITIALAKGIGSTKKGAIEVSFDDETFLDLMAEQGVWPIIYNVFMEAYKLELEKGHPSEAILTELYLSHEPEMMMKKAAEIGLFNQLPLHSRTSQYGQLKGFEAFDSKPVADYLRDRYEKISNGEFNKDWMKELDNGLVTFERMVDEVLDNDICRAEKAYRDKIK